MWFVCSWVVKLLTCFKHIHHFGCSASGRSAKKVPFTHQYSVWIMSLKKENWFSFMKPEMVFSDEGHQTTCSCTLEKLDIEQCRASTLSYCLFIYCWLFCFFYFLLRAQCPFWFKHLSLAILLLLTSPQRRLLQADPALLWFLLLLPAVPHCSTNNRKPQTNLNKLDRSLG